jgi:tRNA(Ile)-lysidine synthase
MSSGNRSAPAAETPVSNREAAALFADLADASALVLAVSGGPDSTALLMLAARWRARRKRGPKLLAVTVDHGLRPESAKEAAAAKRLARKLGVPHRTLRWRGAKPKTGVQEAARVARYRLLASAAARAGASHILTAHTLDDQAETVLFRLARGSGLAGLKGIARVSSLPALGGAPSPLVGEGGGGGAASSEHASKSPSGLAALGHLPQQKGVHARLRRAMGGGDTEYAARKTLSLLLVRPLLDIPKVRLVATLRSAKLPFADDPSNRDPRFARPRLRALMPQLAAEGLDGRRLAAFARRAARADAAIERAVDEAQARLVGAAQPRRSTVFAAAGYAALPRELAVRLLGRALARHGEEGPVELGKLEALTEALLAAEPTARFRRTLAGAMVTLGAGSLAIERAPRRRAPTFTKSR